MDPPNYHSPLGTAGARRSRGEEGRRAWKDVVPRGRRYRDSEGDRGEEMMRSTRKEEVAAGKEIVGREGLEARGRRSRAEKAWKTRRS